MALTGIRIDDFIDTCSKNASFTTFWCLQPVFVGWIMKNPIFFTGICYLFCWRLLRPAYVTSLKTGCKYKNFITSGICRTHYIYEIINPDTCQCQITLSISMWDTIKNCWKFPYLIVFVQHDRWIVEGCKNNNHFTLCRSGVWIDMKVLRAHSFILGTRKLWRSFPIKQKCHTTAAFLDNQNYSI